MTIDAIRRMTPGQLVDYVIEWNEMHESGSESSRIETRGARKATQADWDALLG